MKIPLPLVATGLCLLGAVIALLLVPPPGTDRPDAGEARSFRLHTAEGRPLADTDLRGQVVVLYFGYTFCPDVCPTELGYVARVLRALGDDASKVTGLFITVDPERDTPALLAGYAPLFHPRIQALTGSAEELAAVWTTFGVTTRKVSAANGHYLLDHTSTITVLDRQGRLAGTLSSRDSVARGVTTLKTLLETP